MPPPLPVTDHVDARFICPGHFREKAGYHTWRPHGTGDYLAVYTLAGKGRFGIRSGEFISSPGDFTLLRPHTLHDYGVEPTLQRWELLWAHFQPRPHWIDLLDLPQATPESTDLLNLPIPTGPAGDEMFRQFQQVELAARGAGPRALDHAMHGFEAVLLHCDAYNPRSQLGRLDTRIRDAMDFMSQKLASKLTLSDVADAAGLSISRLSAIFRQQVGLSPLQFLERQRLERAERLLQLTSLSIKEIAHRLGFDNPFYFTLRFKRHTGASPRAYRRRYESSAVVRSSETGG